MYKRYYSPFEETTVKDGKVYDAFGKYAGDEPATPMEAPDREIITPLPLTPPPLTGAEFREPSKRDGSFPQDDGRAEGEARENWPPFFGDILNLTGLSKIDDLIIIALILSFLSKSKDREHLPMLIALCYLFVAEKVNIGEIIGKLKN